MRRLICGAIAVALFCLAADAVRANTIQVTFTGLAAGPGSDTSFNYDAQLAATSPAIAGLGQGVSGEYDHFTIFDFAGFDGAAYDATKWNLVVTNVGPAAFLQAPTDSAGVQNITFEWIGGAKIAPPGQALGSFALYSVYNSTTLGIYSSEDVEDPDGSATNFGFQRSGHTALTTVASVPLPATAGSGLLLLSGLGGMGGLRRLNGRRSVVA